MNLNFDSIFFLLLGLLGLWLGLSRSKWLFWGAQKYEKLEKLLGPRYKMITNIAWGLLCLAIGFYFLID